MMLLRERIAQFQETEKNTGDPEVSHCRDMNHVPQWNLERGCRGVGWQCLKCGVVLVVASKIDLDGERPQRMVCWNPEDSSLSSVSVLDILRARREYAEQVLETYRRVLHQDDMPTGDVPAFAGKWFERLSADLRAAQEDLATVDNQIAFLARYMQEGS